MLKCRWRVYFALLPGVLCATLNRRFSSHHVHVENADRKGTGEGECGKRIENPPSSASMDCPFQCPYVRPDTHNFCSFACVEKEACSNRNPLTSFADPRTRVCSPCAVPGCIICGQNRSHCLECGERMILRGADCVARYGSRWLVLYWVAGITMVVLLAYLMCLGLRPDVNHAVLLRAKEYRHNVKLRDVDHIPSRPYPITTNATSEIVSGPGIMLHFSWQRYVIIWAVIVTLLLYSLSWIPVYSIYPPVGEDTHPNDRDVFTTCAAVGSERLKAEVARADWFYLVFTTGIYVFSTIGTFFLLSRHQKACKQYVQMTDKLSSYAVYASGFPERTGQDHLEEEYKNFFQQALQEAIHDVTVIGVSIVWNSHECAEQTGLNIGMQVDCEMEQVDLNYDAFHGVFTERADPETAINKRNCLQSRQCCSIIDNLLMGRFACSKEQEPFRGTLITEKLKTMRSTGDCYVVFKTIEQRNRVVAMERLHYKDVEICLSSVRQSPRTIFWQNMGKQGDGRVRRFIGMSIVLLVCVVLWTICFYWPYASYVIQWTKAPGIGEERTRDEWFQTSLLTLPIIIGNQVMYAVCDKLADRIRCETRGLRDLAYVVLYTVFITIQTVLDIIICISLAYGHHDEEAWKLAQASGVLGPKAIAQNPTIRELLYMELVQYLYPITLGVCYLMEPIMLGVLPYFVFKWLIRSRADIGIQEAETLLAPFPFDLSRYGDIMISVTCCVLVLFIASPDVYIVFVWLSGMLLFCYVWDHYRLLRLSQANRIDTNLMDEYCTMMLAVPCALLAACVVFRRYGAQYRDFSRSTVPLACVAAFFAHLAIHICIIQWLIGRNENELRREEQEMNEKLNRDDLHPYESIASHHAYNYFNTNLVHCLRSKYIYATPDSTAWCIPARPGREYLLKKAPEFGQYYEMVAPMVKSTMRDDMKQIRSEVEDHVKDVTDSLRSAADSISPPRGRSHGKTLA